MRKSLVISALFVSTAFSSVVTAGGSAQWDVRKVANEGGSTVIGERGDWTFRADSVEQQRSGGDTPLIASGHVRLLGPNQVVVVADRLDIGPDRAVFPQGGRLLNDGWGVHAKSIEVDLATGKIQMSDIGHVQE